jgi:Peroxidase
MALDLATCRCGCRSTTFLNKRFSLLGPVVAQAIADILDDENFDDGSLGPVFVRLAWHQAGSYDLATGTGGSNGCTIRFNPEAGYGANAGACLPPAAAQCLLCFM